MVSEITCQLHSSRHQPAGGRADCRAGVWALVSPYPYREISGGRELFLLLVAVDVVMGPLITLMIFNTGKPRRELQLDLIVVGVLQLAALAYGLSTVYAA